MLTKRSVIALITALGLLAISSIALAEHETDHPEDTEFSFGYDEENHVLAVNVGPNDGLYVCKFDDGLLRAQYGEADEEGIVPVDSLEDEDGPKEFDPRLEHELADGLEPADEPFAYAGPDGECRVNGIVVAGPNGQVNHGQFMKAFRQLIDFKGHGCINRYLAQSDLGKTDSTKVKTPDADPDHTLGDSGELSFLSFEADCVHGKKDKDGPGGSDSKGPEAKGKDKPKKEKANSPGNSANAPGKNK